MALSGKDTGGSQWFVTHSPNSSDGGHRLCNVVAGMDVVDPSRAVTLSFDLINEAADVAQNLRR